MVLAKYRVSLTDCNFFVSKGGDQRLRAFKMKTYRRLLGISLEEEKTNDWVLRRVVEICGHELEGFVEMVKKRKLRFYGHEVSRGGLLKSRMEGRRGRGRPQGNWQANLKHRFRRSLEELKELAKNQECWKELVNDWVHPWPLRPRR